MADWELLELSIAVKGKDEEVAKMRKRFSTIIENTDKLDDAKWLRSLFENDELSEILETYGLDDDDEGVINAFNSFAYDWNEISDHGAHLKLMYFSVNDGDLNSASFFVQALVNCFPSVNFDFVATGYNSSNDDYVAFVDDDFQDLGGNDSWSGDTGRIVYERYKEWRKAQSENWLLPDDASNEVKAKAEQKEKDAKVEFKAIEYAYNHLDTDGELSFDENNIKLEDKTISGEMYLSLVYNYYCLYYPFGELLKTIYFGDCKEQPNLPKNLVEAVKNGKIILEGYKNCKKAIELDPEKESSKEMLERCQKAVKSAPVKKESAPKAPAAKKPTVKKLAVKKPAAKKAEVKKPTDKKPTAKKAEAKKPTVKKTEKKPTAVKKPVAKKVKKTETKKPAISKKTVTVKKAEAKPAKKNEIKKPVAAKKPVTAEAKKTAVKKTEKKTTAAKKTTAKKAKKPETKKSGNKA